MKFSELQNKDHDQLHSSLKELQSKLAKFRFEIAEKKLQDFSQIKKTKKDIARILTALNK